MKGIKDKMASALAKAFKNAPVSEKCPLILNEKWNCRPKDKGNEPCCNSISGYTSCPRYLKWFYWLVTKAIAKELGKGEPKREKEAKRET
ncbi:MAG: hypothetical protein PHF35_04065 [Candidatus Moranbacteria bacterium]|nr:hypothetical protein [Candidatus Moranbacteria bacterium]